MNLLFWKKKKKPGESDPGTANETVVAGKIDATPAKPSFWTRLKSTLSPSHKKNEPDKADEAKPSPQSKDDKHQDDEPEAPLSKPGFLTRLKSVLFPSHKKSLPDEGEDAKPSAKRKDNEHPEKEPEAQLPKPGFLAQLKSTLMPSRNKDKTDNEEKSEELRPSAKRTNNKPPDDESLPPDITAAKPRKWPAIVLGLLIPLAAGGGFLAAIKFLPPPQHQEAPPPKVSVAQEAKAGGQPSAEPTQAAEQAPLPEPEQPLTEPAPQQADNASPPVAEAPEPPAEEPVADAPAPTEEDIQAQIQAMKKHNQEMQAQIEALKKRPAVARPARSAVSVTPREGVLIINGKDTKESVLGLKKVIEGMNAASEGKEPGKK